MSILTTKTADGIELIGFTLTTYKNLQEVWARLSMFFGDAEDQIEAGNMTQAEMDAFYEVWLSNMPTPYIWAPYSVLELIDAVAGDEAHNNHANARTEKHLGNRAEYLRAARMWSAVEFACIQALAQYRANRKDKW